jgi:STIP1 homology and U-box containing protein 1
MDDPKSVYTNFAKYLDKDDDHKPLDVPDFLKCAISDDLMQDPVVIQSGHTYEREMITKHFQMSGAFDPITRQEVDPSVLIPNHMLKKASESFLSQNPWAYQHLLNEDYRNIMM